MASFAHAWISSVDLPMPGSPPMRMTEPGTKPPPVTRSSSLMPEWMRGASRLAPCRSSSGKTRPLPAPATARAPMPEEGASSTIVFHSSHASQRPCQRWDSAPQFWQTNDPRDFAI